MTSKESTHAFEHWVNLQAKEATREAVTAPNRGHMFPSELFIDATNRKASRELHDDMRAAVYPEDFERIRALCNQEASEWLRLAAMMHREEVRRKP